MLGRLDEASEQLRQGLAIAIVLRCLAKDPLARYATASALAEALLATAPVLTPTASLSGRWI